MLEALSIRNLALIDRLDVCPGDGFSALTGETGAGKSILLDGLALVLGAPADRGLVRRGSERASVAASFALPPDHPVWAELECGGIDADPAELLILRRVVQVKGPSKAHINDQPVSASVLSSVGGLLVEIHGQHAAAALMRPGEHRAVLDRFADAGDLLEACASAWRRKVEAEARLAELQSAAEKMDVELEALAEAHGALDTLSPAAGEAETLAAERSRLMQAGRLNEHITGAETALTDNEVAEALASAARRLDQVCRLPGYDTPQTSHGAEAQTVRDGLERALIELQEAERGLSALSAQAVADPSKLDDVEGRLFALRAAARKHGVMPDQLPDVLAQLSAELASLESGSLALSDAEKAARMARADWHGAANALTLARESAAKRLESRVEKELKPLKLEKAKFRVGFEPIEPGRSGALGAEKVTFQWDANGSGGFGALSKVASGGELSRLCLALNCALATSQGTTTLIFDEIDQGVGGAVAAAIGQRLSRLSADRQVLAVTHSPQVAAAASQQWAVSKSVPAKGLGRTCMTGLDDGARLEEIARMLAGARVTQEARAAAVRLLEDGCSPRKRQKS